MDTLPRMEVTWGLGGMASHWQSIPHFSVGDSIYILDSSSQGFQVIVACRWNEAVGEWFYQVANQSWYRQSEVVSADDWDSSFSDS